MLLLMMLFMMMMMLARKTMTTTMRRLFGYHYHNPIIIAIVIMALAVGRKLPPVVNGHAHRWRNTGYDVMEEDDFDEGSTDSAYRMTSYDDDDDVDVNFDPDLSYLTRCQKHRKNEKTFNVSCHDDGSYNSTQCHAETMECWCVDDNGDYIQDSIRKLPERPKCQEKVRPTFTLTLVTPSKQPSTTSIINRLFEKAGIPSPNQQQLGYTDPVPSEDALTQRNQRVNQSRNDQEEEDDDDDHHHRHHNRHQHHHNDDDDDDDDDGEIGVKNHRDVGDHGNGMMKEFDDDDDDDDDDADEDDEDEGDDDDDDGVTQTSSNKLLRRDPVYTTGLILVVLLSSSIVIIVAVLFIHRIKRKDEGTYTLASNAIISTIGYSVSKDTEYFA